MKINVVAVKGRLYPDYDALEDRVAIRRYVGCRWRSDEEGWVPTGEPEGVKVGKASTAALLRRALRNGDLLPYDCESRTFAGLDHLDCSCSKVTKKLMKKDGDER